MTALTSHSPFTSDAPLRVLALELDPAPTRLELARDRYRDLGEWLKEHATDSVARDVQVYPQGSFNLGTTNQDPLTGEFDIDLVLRVAYLKEEIGKIELNRIVNGWLGSYVSVRQREDHPLAPTRLHQGKRAWTLTYDDHFHMDALPVVPATLSAPTSVNHDLSWLTDKKLTRWQPTNPRGFAAWFRDLIDEERRILAKRAEVQVHDLPDAGPRSVLQTAIKLLKRHRDCYFTDDPDKLAPPSALISALAARAYEHLDVNDEDPSRVLAEILPNMPRHLKHRDGQLWVANPRCDDENYADRYTGDLRKERALDGWLGAACDAFGTVITARGVQAITKAIDGAFGKGLGQRVAIQLGAEATDSRTAGTLSSTASGLLTVAQDPRPHRRHEFFGQ